MTDRTPLPRRIAVLHPSYDGSDAPFKDADVACNPAGWLPDIPCDDFMIHKATAVRQIQKIAAAGYDAVINLCDGAWDEDRAGYEVVTTLERLNVAFTGAGSAFYDPSREAMKMACHAAGVAFPAYVVTRGDVERDVSRALASLRFPMIVKHPNSYSSVGMTAASRVSDETALRREITRLSGAYGAALVEEFIEGREFTVLVAEPRDDDEDAWALAPVEFTFPAGESFKHFDLKWERAGEMDVRGVDDRVLDAALRHASRASFVALNGSSYARCDLRVNTAGEVFVLEINPYPGIFYPHGSYGSADFILAHDPVGHRGFLEHLLRCAERRRVVRSQLFSIEYTRGRGFGLYAARDIAPGQVIERYEERAQVLVSAGHVAANWRGLRREWFERYAWPVGPDTFVTWDADPAGWRPINHSCDPNAWLTGQDIVARRDIRTGEEITMDYATFCGEGMAAFACSCGASACRGTVCGDDFRLPALAARYGDHVSGWVRGRRGDPAAEPATATTTTATPPTPKL